MEMDNYVELLSDIKQNGSYKPSRAGRIKYLFGQHLNWDVSEKFPLLTIKHTSFHNVAHELLWFLGAFDDQWKKFGNTNIRYLVDHNVHIWDDDCYRNYVESIERDNETKDRKGIPFSKKEFIWEIQKNDEFALQYGDMGPIYGHQWTNWNGIDQIQFVIDQVTSDPYSRRHVVTAWNPEDVKITNPPPCHYGFTLDCSAEDELSLLYTIRSNDLALGAPYNCSSYSLLLYMICFITGKKPNQLSCSITNAHIYENQMDGVDEILSRYKAAPELPTLEFKNTENIKSICDFRIDNFEIKNYNPLPAIKIPLSVGL